MRAEISYVLETDTALCSGPDSGSNELNSSKFSAIQIESVIVKNNKYKQDSNKDGNTLYWEIPFVKDRSKLDAAWEKIKLLVRMGILFEVEGVTESGTKSIRVYVKKTNDKEKHYDAWLVHTLLVEEGVISAEQAVECKEGNTVFFKSNNTNMDLGNFAFSYSKKRYIQAWNALQLKVQELQNIYKQNPKRADRLAILESLENVRSYLAVMKLENLKCNDNDVEFLSCSARALDAVREKLDYQFINTNRYLARVVRGDVEGFVMKRDEFLHKPLQSFIDKNPKGKPDSLRKWEGIALMTLSVLLGIASVGCLLSVKGAPLGFVGLYVSKTLFTLGATWAGMTTLSSVAGLSGMGFFAGYKSFQARHPKDPAIEAFNLQRTLAAPAAA